MQGLLSTTCPTSPDSVESTRIGLSCALWPSQPSRLASARGPLRTSENFVDEASCCVSKVCKHRCRTQKGACEDVGPGPLYKCLPRPAHPGFCGSFFEEVRLDQQLLACVQKSMETQCY
jgi:hypothetical protein